MHQNLKTNKKIKLFENTDIRDFNINMKFDIITSDVSFISVLKIIDKIDLFAKDKIIILFKPQFEVGKDVKRDNKGVVLDKKQIQYAKENFLKTIITNYQWHLIYSNQSKISGKDGNIEELFYFRKYGEGK